MAYQEGVQEVLDKMVFTGEIGREDLILDELGFLAVRKTTDDEQITAVGFYAPTPSEGKVGPRTLQLPTQFEQVPPADQTIDLLGKGVGRRLYNTPHATSGLAYRPVHVQAYPFTVARSDILDLRIPADTTLIGKATRIAQHAGRIVSSRLESVEQVVARIHEDYGNREAVIIGQPPRAALRQRMRGVPNPLPPAFLLTRREGEATRIGYSYSIDDWK